MNAREKVGVSLTFAAVGILIVFLSYTFWDLGHNVLAYTNQQAFLVLAPCVAMVVAGSLLVKGRPLTKVLRQQE
jgi:hypothetical protein